MRKRWFIVLIVQFLVSICNLNAQSDSIAQSYDLEEISVVSTRFGDEKVLNKTLILSKDVQLQNMGENLPYLLQKSPSLVVTSDDGLGIGYTYFRVRGTDQSRINMTINGIPLNDSESQSVFWVNMTDMVGSLSSIEVQRGVGTSTNGAAAFGASVNMQTELIQSKPYAEISFNGGMYNTFRESVKAGTGLLKHGFSIDARYSKVNSEGYINYGSSDLHSYFISGAWQNRQTMVKVLAFGGKEKTGIAWNGISPTTWETTPRYNNAGEYFDENGVKQYYANSSDNYEQQHYQFHILHFFNSKWNLGIALHYTHGSGFTERIKYAKLKDFLLTTYFDSEGNEIAKSNLIYKKYLLSDFYGGTISANYTNKSIKVNLGGAVNNYNGLHNGQVVDILDSKFPISITPNYEYYRNYGNKFETTIFSKVNWQIIKGLAVFADLQYRYVNYHLFGVNDENLEKIDMRNQFHFFNPKIGIFYQYQGHHLYGNFAVANREPSRKNYTESGPNDQPMHETLYDYELGYSYKHTFFSVGANLYFMDYDNQLVLTGKLSDTGAALTRNVKNSYRMGVELVGGVDIAKCLRWDLNFALSRNKILNFTDWVDDWQADWSKSEVVQSSGQVAINYGTTTIAFSPNITLGSTINFSLLGFTALFQTNFVGSQYLDNTMNSISKIPAYCVNNLHLSYSLPLKKVLKTIILRVQMNNIFNTKYVSNGWSYGYFDGADSNGKFSRENQKYELGYFAQAGFNIHAGIIVRF